MKKRNGYQKSPAVETWSDFFVQNQSGILVNAMRVGAAVLAA
jgi:hypothetical protein